MPIDDPQKAYESMPVAESSLVRLAAGIATVFASLPSEWLPAGLETASFGAAALATFLEKKAAASQQEYLNILAGEIEYVKSKQVELSAARSDFMQNEFPGLLIDGMQRAGRSRTQKRVQRLARVLGKAVADGDSSKSDLVEEMSRLVENVGDRDVIALGVIHSTQQHLLRNGRGLVSNQAALSSWNPIAGLRQKGFSDSEILSIGAKLESLGLVRSVNDKRLNNLADDPGSFGLLQRGLDFVLYLRGAQSASDL